MTKKKLTHYVGWLKTLNGRQLRMEMDQRHREYVATKELWELADNEHYRRFDEHRQIQIAKRKTKKGK